MPTLRPASVDDAPAVLALYERSDAVEFGSLQMDLSELTGPLTADGCEAVLWADGDRVLGYAHLAADGETETVVDPDHPGLQEHLLDHVLRRAQERGLDRLEHWTGPREDSPVAALLRRRGFTHARTAWHLSRSGPAPRPALPTGVLPRAFDPERDGREVHALVQRAFAGSFGSHPRSYEEWSHLVLGAGADVLCLEQDGRLVAAATHLERLGAGHVGQLAVASEHRGRGLARALLHEAFRRDHLLGRPTTLGVDGENAGARRLYDGVGMQVVEEFRRWERQV